MTARAATIRPDERKTVHEHHPIRTRRSLTVAAAGIGIAAVLAGCGNADGGEDLDVSNPSASNTGKPGATKALRSACLETNDKVVSANATWNKAVDSHKADDLTKATASMTTLASTLRDQGTKSANTSFKQKADKVATNVESLTKAKTPSKTVDTTTYNDAVDDLTAYCGQMFPAATKKSA